MLPSADMFSGFYLPVEHTPKSSNMSFNNHDIIYWSVKFNSSYTTFSLCAYLFCLLLWEVTAISCAAPMIINYAICKRPSNSSDVVDLWPLQSSDVLSCRSSSWVRLTWEERFQYKNLKWKLNSKHSLVTSVSHHNGCTKAENHSQILARHLSILHDLWRNEANCRDIRFKPWRRMLAHPQSYLSRQLKWWKRQHKD